MAFLGCTAGLKRTLCTADIESHKSSRTWYTTSSWGTLKSRSALCLSRAIFHVISWCLCYNSRL